MKKAQHLQQHIAEEVRRIRHELRTIAASLHPRSDAQQRAAAEKQITELEERIVSLEALKQRGRAAAS
jgi:cob(I)alamin adenosyltransferase